MKNLYGHVLYFVPVLLSELIAINILVFNTVFLTHSFQKNINIDKKGEI